MDHRQQINAPESARKRRLRRGLLAPAAGLAAVTISGFLWIAQDVESVTGVSDVATEGVEVRAHAAPAGNAGRDAESDVTVPANVVDSSEGSTVKDDALSSVAGGGEGAVDPAQLVGVWTLNDNISRTLETFSDGTGHIDVKLDFVSSFLYGSRLSMDLEWKLEGDHLTQVVTGGTPEKNVKRLLNDFGNSRAYRIVDVTDEFLLLETLGNPPMQERWERQSGGTAAASRSLAE